MSSDGGACGGFTLRQTLATVAVAIATLLLLVLDGQQQPSYAWALADAAAMAIDAAAQGLRAGGKNGSAAVRLWSTAECMERFPGLQSPPLYVPVTPEAEDAAADSAERPDAPLPLPRVPGLMPRAYHGEIPVFVHIFNNPTFAMRILAELDCYSANIVLVDSASTFAPTHALLAATASLRLRATGKAPPVVQLDQNLGPRVAMIVAAQSLGWPAFLAFTDADIALGPLLPPLFLETMANLTLLFPPNKVAFKLETESRPEDFLPSLRTQLKEEPRLFVSQNDSRLVLAAASADTTFSVYNGRRLMRSLIVDAVFDQASRYITPYEFFRAVSVAGVFTCEHLPWRKNFTNGWTAAEIRAVFGRESRDWSTSSAKIKEAGNFTDDDDSSK